MRAAHRIGAAGLLLLAALDAQAQQIVGLGAVNTGICVGTATRPRVVRLTAIVQGVRLPAAEPLARCLHSAAAEVGSPLLANEPVKASALLKDRGNRCLSTINANERIDQIVVRAEPSC